MATTRLTKFELQIMDLFWKRGASCVREILDEFPEAQRPAYTTIQTTVYRLETKGSSSATRTGLAGSVAAPLR